MSHPQPSFKKLAKWSLLLLGCLCSGYFSSGQCTSATLFPSNPRTASDFNDVITVSAVSRAGDYYVVNGLALNRSYVFTSSNPADYITIRNVYTSAVLGHGPVPYTYNVGSGPDLVQVHLTLALACGTQAISRSTSFFCSNCPPIPGGVGVNNNNPRATLDVAGEIKLGTNTRPAEAGMVRWNPTTRDFEGYDGTNWLSLTRSNAAPGQWGQVSAANIQENNKLTASDGAASDFFGSSVSISGDYAIIGANTDDVGANVDQGSAYIFVRNGNNWTQQAKLTAADGASNDRFGNSVSISSDYAIVGADEDDIGSNANQGSAYIFVRSGTNWTQQAKLTASDGVAGELFGSSVSINGDYAIIGAYGDDVGANVDQGSAYIFVRNGSNWTQQAKLTALDGAANDEFGTSVSISGDYAIIGAYLDDVGANGNQGSAYVFMRSGTTWTQQAKLTASNGAAGDVFGYSVSISGDYAIIGAYLDDVGANVEQGSAYIFVRSGTNWTQQAKLTASDGAANDFLGLSVSISGDYGIMGVSRDDVAPNANQGSAYIIRRN